MKHKTQQNPRYPLWEYLMDQHNIILLDGDIDEIVNYVRNMDNQFKVGLPSDEEIKAELDKLSISGEAPQTKIDGAKWMRDKCLQATKDK
jgi:hypothetical protein